MKDSSKSVVRTTDEMCLFVLSSYSIVCFTVYGLIESDISLTYLILKVGYTVIWSVQAKLNLSVKPKKSMHCIRNKKIKIKCCTKYISI